jgi:DNA sulfur modification protein DndB
MTISSQYLMIQQINREFILTKLPLGLLTKISYTAVRGQSQEEGAVQRVLNSKRIASVKDFTLNIGDYPGDVVLNWTNKENPIQRNNGELAFDEVSDSAQIIDGQHRLAGIKEAIKENPDIAKYEIPVVIYENLSTRECADIFLSINTEQKTVSRSLVLDLYGVANEAIVDPAAVRARDIALFLNEEENSPYQGNIKLPGSLRKRGGIELSTIITAIKPLVEETGDFERIGITELELQKKILLNFFLVLQGKYGEEWDKKTNAFQYAAGFVGAINFFKLKIVSYCNANDSFSIATMERIIQLDKSNLIYQSEVKGTAGKEAQNKIYNFLLDKFIVDKQQHRVFEI